MTTRVDEIRGEVEALRLGPADFAVLRLDDDRRPHEQLRELAESLQAVLSRPLIVLGPDVKIDAFRPDNRVRKALYLAATLIDNGHDPANALETVRVSYELTDDQTMQVQSFLPDEVTG